MRERSCSRSLTSQNTPSLRCTMYFRGGHFKQKRNTYSDLINTLSLFVCNWIQLNRQTDLKGQHSFILFLCVFKHLSGFKLCCGNLIFLLEQLVYSGMELIDMWCFVLLHSRELKTQHWLLMKIHVTGAAAAQSEGTWIGDRRVAGSRATRPSQCGARTGTWRGASSPPGDCRGVLERGTNPPPP